MNHVVCLLNLSTQSSIQPIRNHEYKFTLNSAFTYPENSSKFDRIAQKRGEKSSWRTLLIYNVDCPRGGKPIVKKRRVRCDKGIVVIF